MAIEHLGHKPKVQFSGGCRAPHDDSTQPQAIKPMKKRSLLMNYRSFLLIALCIGLASARLGTAATVPAGTRLMVRTNAAMSTHSIPGRHFTATLDQGVGALPAGTQVSGTIRASRYGRSTTRTEPLTLVLNTASVNGHKVHLKTSPVYPKGAKTTRSRRGSFSFGEDIFPAGTRLEFHLMQPLHL